MFNMHNILGVLQLCKPTIEILILWLIIYHIMRFFEGTRAIHVLRGIIILMLGFFLFQKLGFDVLEWLMTKLFAISIIAIFVIFHPEIRQGLARLGRRHLFGSALREEDLDYILHEMSDAVENIAKNKFGALIAIEKNDPLVGYIETGEIIDARVSSDLIQAIFTPNNPLHDGGIIIQHGRIISAGCIFPLTHNQDLSRVFGTRHRAAIGLSEETDAVVVIISEERQDISLVYKGRFYKDLGKEEMVYQIKEFIKEKNV